MVPALGSLESGFGYHSGEATRALEAGGGGAGEPTLGPGTTQRNLACRRRELPPCCAARAPGALSERTSDLPPPAGKLVSGLNTFPPFPRGLTRFVRRKTRGQR